MGLLNRSDAADRDTLRSSYRLVPIAIVVAVVLVVALVGRDESAQAQSVKFPAALEYTLQYADGSGSLARLDFRLEVRSWKDWRMVTTCCVGYEGYVQEQRPDGTVWSGYDSWQDGLVETFSHADDGSVPFPDFSQGRPYDEGAVTGVSGVSLESDTAAAWAGKLGVAPNDVLAYRYVGGVSGVEGLETDPVANSLYVVYKPLRIPMYVEETEDGVLVRKLELLGLQQDS